MKHWFWLSLVSLALSPALALKPEWRQIDVDSNGTIENVAITNLADIAFSAEGTIVGWFVKVQRAKDFKGNYSNVPNLVHTSSNTSSNSSSNPSNNTGTTNKPPVLPGTLSDFVPEKASFLGGNLQAADYNPDSDLVAEFRQGATVLTYKVHPRFLTVDLSVKTPSDRTLTWVGIGGTDRPVTKWLAQSGNTPAATGNGPATYVAWQTQPGAGNALVIQPQTPTKIELNVLNGTGIAQLTVPAGETTLKIYGGANELVRLHVEGFYKLPGLFSPNFWGTISLGMLWALEEAHKVAGGSWIWAIVIVTLLIRILMWPLMHSQYKSMAEMQKIQPELKKLQEKYKDDKQKQQEAMMKLYQEHRINPLAGCFPLLLQMPILFLVYKVMVGYEFGQGFLWIPDLALPDPWYILPVIYILVLLASTWLSAAGNKDTLRQGIIMNLVFAYLLFTFPAGVTIYWVLSTVVSLGQQWLINKQLGIKLTPAKS
jgi:YidC/Oxa1 family membrane protein insertase